MSCSELNEVYHSIFLSAKYLHDDFLNPFTNRGILELGKKSSWKRKIWKIPPGCGFEKCVPMD